MHSLDNNYANVKKLCSYAMLAILCMCKWPKKPNYDEKLHNCITVPWKTASVFITEK